MSGYIRPSLSRRNKYSIPKHRYYELKHFCLQYPDWKKDYDALMQGSIVTNYYISISHQEGFSDRTANVAIEMANLSKKIKLVEKTVLQATDVSLSNYILIGVTQGVTYDQLSARYRIPCCRKVYYETYRRFFWMLSNSQE